MELVKYLVDLFLHLDKHLSELIVRYGALTYSFLFAVIFAETGFIITPFLPGDSLIFAAGTFAAKDAFNVNLLFLILAAAAILGDTVNYWIGHYIGPKIFEKEKIRFLKKEHLIKTHQFYEKYGGKTIILGRFIPIVRTFVPFVAGIGSMTYSKFIIYNIVGGIAWVALFLYGGFFFGNIEFVKNNFSIAILVIIFISVLPGIIEFLRNWHRRSTLKADDSSSMD
jgi:membrane-associated protein